VKKLKKSEIIEQFIDEGLFDTTDIGNTKQLIGDAGDRLDDACSHDICGSPLFRCADGKWYVGNVEFSIAPVNPAYLVDTLVGDEFCECDNCGHLEKSEDLDEIVDETERVDEGSKFIPDGQCTKCGALSYKISKTRAEQIAGITKVPKKRRKGLK